LRQSAQIIAADIFLAAAIMPKTSRRLMPFHSGTPANHYGYQPLRPHRFKRYLRITTEKPMQAPLLLLILTSVAMSACAQLMLKMGVGAARASASAAQTGMAYLLSPWVIAGLALYGLGAVVWLYVLARLPLSAAYPFVGLGFILTMVLGVFALGESLSPIRITGTLLIALGCVCVSRSIA
jgi:multidrug transporter EmrE-like cation transporter